MSVKMSKLQQIQTQPKISTSDKQIAKVQGLNITQSESLNEQPEQNLMEVAGFVAKTFEILSVADFGKIVYWSCGGSEFTIKDVTKFQEIVLPKYFRHNKMNSFVRQLNMYGFHKTKHNNFKCTFKHPMFLRNRDDLLHLVKRKLKNSDPKSQYPLVPNNKQNPNKQNNTVIHHYSQSKGSTSKKQSQVQQKQSEITSVSLQKYFNFSNQFIGTTKMINFSLKKVSFNDFDSIEDLLESKNQDCASIEDQIDQSHKHSQTQNRFLEFQNVSCFFSSRFNI